MAWVRAAGDTEELVFSADSRLSGGPPWDCCAKIFLLPRSDCAIAFAGQTYDAFPLIFQFVNWFHIYQPAADRSADLTIFRRHMRRMFSDMWASIPPLPHGERIAADCQLLFGGYDARFKQFKIWRFFFRGSGFDFEPAGSGHRVSRKHPLAFAGDGAIIQDAKQRIRALLIERGKLELGQFDMEPFEVLRDLLREKRYTSIGGAPQIVKIYQHMNSAIFAVTWPNSQSDKYVFGRRILPYEEFDPDNPVFHPSLTRLRRRN
jgi:hypothetical protein